MRRCLIDVVAEDLSVAIQHAFQVLRVLGHALVERLGVIFQSCGERVADGAVE